MEKLTWVFLIVLIGCASSIEKRKHHFFNPVLVDIVKEPRPGRYCFKVKNNSTASIAFEMCHNDLETTKQCYLKLSTLQRALRGIKYRNDWRRYKPPYIVIVKRKDGKAGELIENFEACELKKNSKILYNNVDPFSSEEKK